MTETIDNSLEKISENIGFLTKKIQDVDTELSKSMTESEKKQDSSLQNLEKKLDEELKKYEDTSIKIQKQEEEIKSQNEIIKSLEAMIKRPGNMLSNEQDNEYKMAMDRYIRYGEIPSDELVKKGIENIYCKGNEPDTKDKILNIIGKECNADKGFIIETKTVRTNVGPDGGFLTQPEMSSTFSTREFETSPMRQLAEVVSITSCEYEIIIDDDEGVSGGWVGEESSRPTTDTPTVGKISILTHEIYAQPKVTTKALDDIVDIQSWLQQKTNDKLTREENQAFVRGNGSVKPKGFLSYDAWNKPGTYERGKIEEIKSGVNGVVVSDALIDLQNSLLSTYQANAVWTMQRQTWKDIAKLKDGSGRYLLDMNAYREGFALRLLGKPIVFMTDMDAVATDAKAIAYGDFRRGYIIVDRIGIRVLRDSYSSKPYILFYTTKRVGGDVKNFEAIKINKLSA